MHFVGKNFIKKQNRIENGKLQMQKTTEMNLVSHSAHITMAN